MIVVSFLPIYVLSGPSGTLFHGGHDDFCAGRFLGCHADVAAGAVFVVHAEGHCKSAIMPPGGHQNRFTSRAWISAWPILEERRLLRPFCWWFRLLLVPRVSAPSLCRIWMKGRYGCAPRCRTPFPLMNRRRSPQVEDILLFSRSHHGSLEHRAGRMSGTDATGFFSTSRFTSASKPTRNGPVPCPQGCVDRGHQPKAPGLSRDQF